MDIKDSNRKAVRLTIISSGMTQKKFAKANGIDYEEIRYVISTGYAKKVHDEVFTALFPGYTPREVDYNPLREYRKSKNMTRKEMAELLGICTQHVSNLEWDLTLAGTKLQLRITEKTGIDLKGYANKRNISDSDLNLIHHSPYKTYELSGFLFKSTSYITQVKGGQIYSASSNKKEVKNFKKPEITLERKEFALLKNFTQLYPDRLVSITKVKDDNMEYIELKFKDEEYVTLLPVPVGTSFLALEHDKEYLPQEMWL